MGKSTSAQLLARERGYVYYEADTFRRMVNPFIPLNVDNPSMAITRQKKLNGTAFIKNQDINIVGKHVYFFTFNCIWSLDLGQGAKERSEVIRDANAEWASMMKGLDINMDAVKAFYRELAVDIKTQRERIGGDWAVAHVLIHREIRDMIR